MKTVKKSIVCIVALACWMAFGAWTPTESDAQARYADAPFLSTYASENIYYTNKVIVAENNTVNNMPTYVAMNGLSNACGAVAGTMVVGFYDKYFPDLIPGWDSYFPNGKYRGQDRVYAQAVMEELYTLMRTNVDDVGVSESDFLNGLRQYIHNQGHTINYTKVATETTLNYAACKNTIDSNNLIVIFFKPGEVYTIGLSDDHDSLIAVNISGFHIMVAYGYYEVNYYNANGLFRTDTYLKVVTGRNGTTNAFYKISPHNLASAYAVSIQ